MPVCNLEATSHLFAMRYSDPYLKPDLGMDLPDNDLLACLPVLTDEEKHHRTLAGLADVDAGRTISHEEMRAWARSLLCQANSAK